MVFRKLRLGQLGRNETVAFAVSEIVRYVKKVDPALLVEVLLLDEPDAACGDVVWVGRHESFPVPEVRDTRLDDAVVISVKDGAGYISGSNDCSVLLAAYRFLRELGCDWVRPGEDGFRVARQELSQISVSVTEVPSYRYRSMYIEGAVSYEHVKNMIDYLPKVGMNGYLIQFMVPATFLEQWTNHDRNSYAEKEAPLSFEAMAGMVRMLEQEIKKRGLRYHKVGHGWNCTPFGMDGTGWHLDREHTVPEHVKPWLAQLNGVRQLNHNSPLDTQLCYSVKEVRDIMTDYIVEYCRNNPQVDVVNVWPADNVKNYCECENCRKLRPADWYLMILNELDEKLTKAGLETRISFCIYLECLWPPLKERIKNPDRFEISFAPITRTFNMNYGECAEEKGETVPFELNQAPYPRSVPDHLEYLRQWQEFTESDIFLVDYLLQWAHVNDPGYERCARQIFDDMRSLHRIGLEGSNNCQIQRCAFPTNLPTHMMARALWDENCDYDVESAAWYRSAFGSDGDKVQKYLQEVSDKLTIMLMRTFGEQDRPRGPYCTDYDRLFRLVEEFLPEIQKHTAEENAYTREWKALELHNAYLKHYLKIHQLREQGDDESCYEEAWKLFDLIAQNEDWLHPVLDVNLTIYVLRRRLQIPDDPGAGAVE